MVTWKTSGSSRKVVFLKGTMFHFHVLVRRSALSLVRIQLVSPGVGGNRTDPIWAPVVPNLKRWDWAEFGGSKCLQRRYLDP